MSQSKKRGIVSSSHPLISETGQKILSQQGNAMDACLAMALTSSVVLPDMCGIGGDGFLLYYEAQSQEIIAITGSGWTGNKYTSENYRNAGFLKMPHDGILSIGVPGLMALLDTAFKSFGSKPLASYFEDSIQLAREGFPRSQRTARSCQTRKEFLDKYDEVKKLYDTDYIKNPKLADFLESLSKASFGSFYPLVSQHSLDKLNALGAWLDASDFLEFSATTTNALAMDYHGYQIHQTPLPSQGFVQLNQMKLLESYDLSTMTESEYVHYLVEANKIAFENRSLTFKNQSSIETLLDSKQILKDRQKISEKARESKLTGLASHTTSFVAMDQWGNACSFITSVSDVFGSGIVDPSFGFLYNNRVGTNMSLNNNDLNQVQPRKQPISTIHCYLVTKEKELVLAGGIPGGDYQPIWNTQILTRILNLKQTPQEAINMYRFQVENNSNPYNRPSSNLIKIEEKLSEEVIADLKLKGHSVELVAQLSGSAQVVQITDTGYLAGSDPRTEGCYLKVE